MFATCQALLCFRCISSSKLHNDLRSLLNSIIIIIPVLQMNRLTNLPKLAQQSHDARLASQLPRLCVQPLGRHCFSMSLYRKRSRTATNPFNFNGEKKGEEADKKKENSHPESHLSLFPVTFLCAHACMHTPTETETEV